MKNLGYLHHFLGIEVSRDANGLFLSQSKYVKDLLSRTSMLDCKPYGFPCNYKGSHHTIDASAALLTDPTLYRSIIGALPYLTLTRPDLTFVVNQACQHMHNPTVAHFTSLKQILHYLKGTLPYGILNRRGSLTLTAYSDMDWAGDPVDRCSTTDYCVLLGSSPISWCAKKHTTVARSSTEAEYRSLAHTTVEFSWLRLLFKDLQIFRSTCPTIWCDNVLAISLASNPMFHACTRHEEVNYHFVREKVLNKDIVVQYVPAQEKIVDIFTKGLHLRCFQYLWSKLNYTSQPEGTC